MFDKWRVDELYEEYVIGAVDSLAEFFAWADKWIVDFLLARVTAFLVSTTGTALRFIQTGRVQTYAAVMVLGLGGVGWFFVTPRAEAEVDANDDSGVYSLTAAEGLGYSYRWDLNNDGKWDSDKEKFGNKTQQSLNLASQRESNREARSEKCVRSNRRSLVQLRASRSRSLGLHVAARWRLRSGASSTGPASAPEAPGNEMNPLALALFQIAPYLLAFTVGVLIPRRQGTPGADRDRHRRRAGAAVVRGLWPSATGSRRRERRQRVAVPAQRDRVPAHRGRDLRAVLAAPVAGDLEARHVPDPRLGWPGLARPARLRR